MPTWNVLCPANQPLTVCPDGKTTMAEGSTSINDCSVTVSCEGKEKEEYINSWGCYWYVENGDSTLQSCDVCPAGSTDGLKCPLNSQSNEGAFKKSKCYIDSSNKISDSTGGLITYQASTSIGLPFKK